MEDFRKITIERLDKHKLVIHNPTRYPLVGQGMHGAVFKLSSDSCVKIFADQFHAEIEGNVYKTICGSPILPKTYEIGDKCIVMEYIDGPNLRDYLVKKGG